MSNKGDYGAIPLGDGGDTTPRNTTNQFPSNSALVAEFFGTATLVQIGCGANCVATYLGALTGIWQAASVWTLGATLGIYISASRSGGHLNPAVTLAFALVRRDDFPMTSILPYWVAQLAGAFSAGVINLFLFTTAIKKFEADLGEGESLTSATAFGDYWR
jgi:glycerol uptake facilitator protein